MGLKDIFNAGRCLLGFHEGPWAHRAKGDCTLVQTCSRCGQRSERVEHTWGSWRYQAEGSCTTQRVCDRCQHAEHALEHRWGESVYAAECACERVAVCSRCDAREPRDVVHQFGDWTYRSDDECAQVDACTRCGTKGTASRVQHDWDAWVQSEFYDTRVRVCGHCGDLVLDAQSGPVSMRALEADAARVAAARSESDYRHALASATLLDPIADKYFQFALDQYPEDVSRRVAAAHGVVAYCREHGTEATLRELGVVASPSVAAEAAPVHASPAPTPSASQGSYDPRLVGHWQHQEFLGGGSFGGMTMTIVTHCVLDADGACAFWSTRENYETGRWSVVGDELTLQFADSAMVRRVTVEGRRMLWPTDGRFRFWERVG